jgi:predicted ATP-dependent protease
MAIPNKSYNNVINTLCRLGQYHEQISTVSVGDIYDVNLESMELFPLLHVNPVNVQTGESELVYNFQIFICDLVSEKDNWETYQAQGLTKLIDNKNNEQQVFNQTLEIATDIIGMLRHSSRQSLAGVDDINQPIYFTQDQFSLEPFQERFDNLLCGYVFSIGVKVMNDFDTCTIPVTNAGAGY